MFAHHVFQKKSLYSEIKDIHSQKEKNLEPEFESDFCSECSEKSEEVDFYHLLLFYLLLQLNDAFFLPLFRNVENN